MRNILLIGWTGMLEQSICEESRDAGIEYKYYQALTEDEEKDYTKFSLAICESKNIDSKDDKTNAFLADLHIPMAIVEHPNEKLNRDVIQRFSPQLCIPQNWTTTSIQNLLTLTYQNESAAAESSANMLGYNRLRELLIKSISHEFKTPLGVIGTATHILKKFWDRLERNERVEQIEDIESSVDRIDTLIQDIILQNKLEIGDIDILPEKHDLQDMVTDMVEGILDENQYDRSRFTVVTTHIPDTILSDKRMISVILNQLISNAVKFSPPGSIIEIAVSGDFEEENIVEFDVKDQGTGINENDIPHLFEPFTRFGNVDAASGTGLGLSIAKQGAVLLGGDLEVESANQGSTVFKLSLPIAQELAQYN